MDDFAGRVLADRYRLPLLPSDAYELAETRAFDTYSGQEVLVRQVPLPETVEAEVVDPDGLPGAPTPRSPRGRPVRGPADPAVLRAVEAARAAAAIPDHPRLDQVFDVFAEAGSLWIVSERVAARPLAALLAEKPLSPYRAAEVASDVVTALRILHAHGWTHRNITTRTVLVCDDGRVVLTGLASGAAEEALCGYAPVPQEAPEGLAEEFPQYDDSYDAHDSYDGAPEGADETEEYEEAEEAEEYDEDAYDEEGEADDDADEYAGRTGGPGGAAYENPDEGPDDDPYGDAPPVRPYTGAPPDVRAARAGAIAAYRAGAQAAARTGEGRRPDGPPVQSADDPDWWARRPGEQAPAAQRAADDRDDDAYGPDGFDADAGDFDDPGGSSGPGHARLAGTWHDSRVPGQDGPPPLPAGGGFLPAEPRALPPGAAPRPLPAALRSPAPPVVPEPRALPDAADRPHPNRDNDPYGVRQTSPAYHLPPGGGRPSGRPAGSALPATRSQAAPAAVSASWDRGGAGREALRADAGRQPAPALPQQSAGGWDEPAPGAEAPLYRGPATPLAAERARQTRIAVVGAVTERWAPEQAGPVHENWQLAAPVGPATDLWALGALLYRSVQGHAPYPEENAAELVQLVCSEPPAFAEECGPLRPVVESLLRQDPTERPDFEELRGWLRSLVRSAPEPEAGVGVVQLPPGVVDGSRLPVVRRRGELVRRRRAGSSEMVHGRHRHKKPPKERRGPRSLGRVLLALILLLMAAAVAYAVMFMPKADEAGPAEPQGRAEAPGPTASKSPAAPERPKSTEKPRSSPSASRAPGSTKPQTSAPAAGNLPSGFALREDPEGFTAAVVSSWQRRPINDVGQVRYADGDFTLIVVPGRDRVPAGGEDPLVYQRDRQRELQPYRDSSWAEATGLRRIQVGQRVMAEGQYSWQDVNGRQVYVRNLVMVLDGRYHVVQVIGPDEQRDKVTQAYRAAVDSYRASR